VRQTQNAAFCCSCASVLLYGNLPILLQAPLPDSLPEHKKFTHFIEYALSKEGAEARSTA
jgi:hypothetical protein